MLIHVGNSEVDIFKGLCNVAIILSTDSDIKNLAKHLLRQVEDHEEKERQRSARHGG